MTVKGLPMPSPCQQEVSIIEVIQLYDDLFESIRCNIVWYNITNYVNKYQSG